MSNSDLQTEVTDIHRRLDAIEEDLAERIARLEKSDAERKDPRAAELRKRKEYEDRERSRRERIEKTYGSMPEDSEALVTEIVKRIETARTASGIGGIVADLNRRGETFRGIRPFRVEDIKRIALAHGLRFPVFTTVDV